MQSDFDNLVCDNSSIGCMIEDPFAYGIVDSLEFDMEALKNKYTNISEEALVFLIKWQSAVGNRPLSTKEKKSRSIGSDLDEGKIDEFRSALPSCSSSLLPPPKRFSRRSIHTTK